MLLLTLTATPWYLWRYGCDWFLASLFLFFFVVSGLSITLGYHRLFSHLSFKARWPVRLFTLLFGAAAFENSVLCWAADHRRHHKFTDHDEDPYNITLGFWHAHMGWIIFRTQPDTEFSGVKDLLKDRLVMWQHNNYTAIAGGMGLILPALLGGLWNGWVGALGGFIVAGIARIVFVQQMTFFINSLCHTLGSRPYSTRYTARDSMLMAFLTFGEGYHNFHHTFQHDYRNGVKKWQFDPTKWCIWALHQLGLASDLRRMPDSEILKAEVVEQQRVLAQQMQAKAIHPAQPAAQKLQAAYECFLRALANWEIHHAAYREAASQKMRASRARLAEIRRDFAAAQQHLREAVRAWREACKHAEMQFA